MICSSRELGLGEDHDGIIVLPEDAGEPGDDARPVLGLDEEVIEFEINPDRAYALSLRGVAREAALAYDAPYPDPARARRPGAQRRRLPGRDRRPGRLPGLRGPHGQRLRPEAADARTGWRSGSRCSGMRPISLAVDVTNYVMLELGRPIHGYDADKLQRPDPGPPGHRGRAADHARRRRPRAVDRGPRRHRRLRDHRPRRRHGRRDHRDVRDHDAGAGRGGALGRRLDVPHRQAAQAHLRGRQAQRARRRPGDHPGRGRPGGRAARRRTAAAPPSPASPSSARRRTAAADRDRLRPAGPDHRHGHPRRHHGRQPRGGRLRGRATATRYRHPAALAPRPHRPLRPGRGGRPDRRLRPGAVGAAPRGRRPRADPRAAAAPPDRPHPGRRRLRRGDQLPVRRRRRASTRSACPPTTCCATRCGWPTRSPPRSRRTPRRCCPACSRPRPATSAAARPGVSLFETGTVAFPVDRGPAPIYGVDWRPSDDELAKLFEALPEQPLHLAVVLAGERERAGWWGAGRTAGWSDAIGLVRRLGAELGVEVEVRLGQPDALAPGPLRPGPVGGVEFGHAGELHPQVCAAFGLPRPHRGRRDRPRLPDGARRRRGARAGVLDVPGRQGGRRPRRRRRRDRAPTSRRRCARARASCSSRSGSSTSTPATRSARATSRWPSRCASARPTGP